MVAIDDIISKATEKYFRTLSNYGYRNYSDVYRMLVVMIVTDIMPDIERCADAEGLEALRFGIESLLGSTCLLPYVSDCGV